MHITESTDESPDRVRQAYVFLAAVPNNIQ